jgi:hypothetical protein
MTEELSRPQAIEKMQVGETPGSRVLNRWCPHSPTQRQRRNPTRWSPVLCRTAAQTSDWQLYIRPELASSASLADDSLDRSTRATTQVK